jgi:hypothetical protein
MIKIKTIATTAFFVIASVASSYAADITGRWTGKIMDQFDVAYDFTVTGEKLTGTTTDPQGNQVEIQDGVIKNDDLSFTIEMMGNPIKVTGKVKGEVILLTMPGMNGGDPMTFELKKAK